MDIFKRQGAIWRSAWSNRSGPAVWRAALHKSRTTLLLALALLPGCTSSLLTTQVESFSRDFSIACARDDDPELVWNALPFVLKTIDARLVSNPRDTNLLATASSLYTKYAYAGLAQDAEFTEERDHERAGQLRSRAVHLLLRARDYGLRGLAVAEPDFPALLRAQPVTALSRRNAADVPLLYWTACAWGAAISLDKSNPELTVDQYVVEALMRRVLVLNDHYDSGGAHTFMIAFEAGRAGVGGSFLRAEDHYRAARRLSGGRLAAPLVTYAESVHLPLQQRDEFMAALQEALQIPLDGDPDQRLANILARRRAEWLLEQADQLFLESNHE